ncbi:MAG: LPS-assembly protein LptD [Odoribacter sp.]|nr:LPS-assembly protein LptD [Odoribacter sp.]
MHIRVSILHFVGLCCIFTVFSFLQAPLSAQEKVDSLVVLPYEPVRNEILEVPKDTLFIVGDTTQSDTILVDSIFEPKPLFQDIIYHTSKDSLTISIRDRKVFLYGDAYVKYMQTELWADFIELDMDRKEAFATGVLDTAGVMVGTPRFKDGDQEFESKELRYNFDTGKGFVKDIITQEGEGYIQGRLTKRVSDSIYYITNGFYTTCDHHEHPHFGIRMRKAKMIKDKKVIVGPSHLVIEDVPLPIGIPFGFFPITKKGTSGILMPTYGEERTRGFNLRNGGYYWYINDYIDAQVLGDIYTNGSWAALVQTNYRIRYKFSGDFTYSMSRNHIGEKDLPDYVESSDWAIRWTHRQDPKANPYSTFSASIDMSSANQNTYNATNLNDIVNQRKQSSISWSKKWPDKPYNLTAAFNHNQNSRDSSISITFPNMNFKVSTIYPLRKKNKSTNLQWYDNIGFSYSAELKNTISTKEDLLFKTPLNQWQNGFKHSIPFTLTVPVIKDVSFNPSLSYNGAAYLHSIRKHYVHNSDTTYVRIDTINGFHYAHNYSTSASLSYAPTIYGMYQFKPESRIEAIRHVLRPSVSFSYTPNVGVSRDKYRRSYVDTLGNEISYSIFEGQLYSVGEKPQKQVGSINIGITNNVEMKVKLDADSTGRVNTKKVKLLESFTINTSYNIFADSMNWSNIRLAARTSIFDGKMSINASGTLDPYYINENAVRINKYHGGIGRLTNASITTGYSFSADGGKNREEKNELVGGFYDMYVDFDVPWRLSFDYSFNFSRSYYRNPAEGARRALSRSTITQNLRVNGDISLTPKWKFSFSSGYDFKNKEVTSTSFNISRDLHCWDMTFSCIPFGNHQSYNFQINVRSSLLQDLKLTKKESWYDNRW